MKQTITGRIINEKGDIIPMDEAHPLYNTYVKYLQEDGTVEMLEEYLPFELEEIAAEEKVAINLQKRDELTDTDWYVIRYIETGKEIPQDILDLRQTIRLRDEMEAKRK